MTFDKSQGGSVAMEDESPASSTSAAWFRAAMWLIGGLFVLRIVYAAIVPLDLVHDEAYYWDWSRQLDWGYYSKPPMIAWLIALSTSLGGSSAFMVRLPAVLLGSGGLLLTYALASRLYGSRTGFWATALLALTPGNAAMSLLMTIDAPFLFFWSATLFAFWRMIERPAGQTGSGVDFGQGVDGGETGSPKSTPDPFPARGRWAWLIVAILATGLGILSKQTMLGFLPLAGLFLLSGRDDRRELLRPTFWLWAVGSLLFLTPVIWWNWQHEWITLEHTRSHFADGSAGWLRRLAVFGEFLATCLGVASPVTAILFVGCGVVSVLHLKSLGRRERYLFCLSMLPLIGVLGLALKQRVEPNWPAGFFPAGLILTAGWLLGRTPLPTRPHFDSRALPRAAVVGLICLAGVYLLPFGGFGLQGTKYDPAVRLRGWRQLGQEVETQVAGRLDPRRSFMVVTAGRAAASELAFYMPSHPQTYLWNPSGHVACQYDVWSGPTDKRGWDALIVTPVNEDLPLALQSAFATVEPPETVRIEIGGGRRHEFRLWRGRDLREWPAPVRLATPAAVRATR